jgi:hypothetical protein
MARISTAHFTYGRDAFARASQKLREGEPRALDDRLMVEALAVLREELRDKNYSDEEIIEVLAAEIDGGATDQDRVVLRTLLRRARETEEAAKGSSKLNATKPRRTGQAQGSRSVAKPAAPPPQNEAPDDEAPDADDDNAAEEGDQGDKPARGVPDASGEGSDQPTLDARALGSQRMTEMAALRRAAAEAAGTQATAPANPPSYVPGTPPSSSSAGN